jgi:nucleoid-associated protein EbfC
VNINPMDILKNLQQIQGKVGEAQSRLKEIVVTGRAGGDMVQVEIDGQFSVRSVVISPEVIDPNDPELIQDLVRAAVTDGLFRAKEAVRTEMSSITGGMGLPPDFLNGLM